MTARDRREDGYSTVLALGLVTVLLTVAGLFTALAAVGAARHRAEAVADVAALAAAGHALEGPDRACAAATRLVDRQHVVLLGCRLEGTDAVVEVGVRPPAQLAGFGLVHGSARAGRR